MECKMNDIAVRYSKLNKKQQKVVDDIIELLITKNDSGENYYNIESNIETGLEELKKYKEGNLTTTSAEDFLNELSY